MSYSVPLFATLQNEGVDLNTSFTFYTTGGLSGWQEYPSTPLTLGQTVLGTLNGKWVLCTAATGTITKYDVVTVSTGFTATQIPTTASLGLIAGVAMATATTGQALWVMTNGVIPAVNMVTGIGANALLYTSATAGRLSANSSAGFTRVQGIVLTTGTTGVAAGAVCGGILINMQVATSQ